MSIGKKKLPRGLTQTPKGWRITVARPGRSLWQKRFPPDTPYEVVAQELEVARAKQRERRRQAGHGTFAADIHRYLTDYFTGHPGYEERARHLQLWLDALGLRTWRSQITRDDIARVLNAWRAAGLAPDTCNKRRTALLALYHALDGRGASNPVREIPKFRSPDPLPRGLLYEQITAALAELPAGKTRVRLAVMAYTGIRQGQLMRLTPEHWDTERELLTVPGTAKGQGTKPYVVPLSAPATQALTAFARLDAWGRFTTAPMARLWKAAAAKAGLPAGTVPYDLRHSFGTAIYRATGDLKVTKELMGHRAIQMTERYTLAAVPERRVAAVRLAFRRGKP